MLKISKTFYKYLLNRKYWAIIFFIIITLNPIVSSIIPYFYKLFVDAIPSQNYELIYIIILAYIGIGVFVQILSLSQYYTGDKLITDATNNIRKDVFKKIQDLDFSFHLNKSSGSLISAFKRGDGALWSFHESIHFKIYNVIVSFGVMLYLFREVSTIIFIVALITFSIGIIITKYFVKINIRTRQELNDSEDEMSHIIVDNMVNFETVKLFAKENWERIRLDNILNVWYKKVWAFILTFRYLDIGMGVVIFTSLFITLVVSLKLMSEETISPGDFIFVLAFTAAFYPKFFELVWGFRTIAKNVTDLEKYFGILDNKVEIADPLNPIDFNDVVGEIEFKNVSFAYEKKHRQAVKNINVHIRQGQSVAFVGRSGSGKTTMIKLLLRFFDVDQGKIIIDGINIKDIKKSDLRSHIGVVPQEPILFNNTIRYNIAYGADNPTWDEIKAAAKMANIDKFIQSLPNKYNTQVGERGIKLSGGQKQRLAIARMILSDPEIIIFDEATSQLDSHSEKLIQEAFWKVSKNKTTLIIAHRLSTVIKADKIVVLKNGRIVESGSHNELLSKHGSLYAYFWDLQTKGLRT